MTQHEAKLSDTRDGLKRLEKLLAAANEHLPGDDVIVASALVNAARNEVAHLLDESRA
jgi:hypothetical protein